MSIRTALTAAWAALHAAQYGFAISSLNGVQGPLTCGLAGSGESHPVGTGPLKDCIPMGVLSLRPISIITSAESVLFVYPPWPFLSVRWWWGLPITWE
ncbi:uncharacterized protein IL334_001215 [Kwoniella shivajii]|uniref:Secreted protein n=1 Tax=Kwoniella shivajii TaxID=564305 RepID=A0ABZ1CRA2_9TREE|nr:hypothetical protein IL334_001215 [Kwoniella shivajii]